jgi:diaminopimelate decarboxylase
VMSAGAYGFTMASNYNSHPKQPEVLVDGDKYYVIRARENFDDLIRGETIPPELQ